MWVPAWFTHISGEGAFFKPHKDTPHSSAMFGLLVINFPANHKSGALLFCHGGGELTFDSAAMVGAKIEPSISFIAFYSGVEHEVTPIQLSHYLDLQPIFFD